MNMAYTESQAQKVRIAEREQLIREIGEKYGIKGFSQSPLEREKIVEFLTRLGESQRKQKSDLEKLQVRQFTCYIFPSVWLSDISIAE